MFVVDGGDEVESEFESLEVVSVGSTQDGEALEPADHVLDDQALAGQELVLLLFVRCEWMVLALLVWSACVGMMLLYPLVPTVGQAACRGQHAQSRLLGEGEVMSFAPGKGGADQAPVARLDEELRFVGVALLLAAVGAPL